MMVPMSPRFMAVLSLGVVSTASGRRRSASPRPQGRGLGQPCGRGVEVSSAEDSEQLVLDADQLVQDVVGSGAAFERTGDSAQEVAEHVPWATLGGDAEVDGVFRSDMDRAFRAGASAFGPVMSLIDMPLSGRLGRRPSTG